MRLKRILSELETSDEFPKLKCPFCISGNLLADKSINISFTNKTSQKMYDVTGEETYLMGEYSYRLICDNNKCKENGIVVGKSDIVENGYDNGLDSETGEELHSPGWNYTNRYRIDYISIPVNLIELPENLDRELEKNIKSSYNLFWSDLNSCGNRLRTVVELLLDKIGVGKRKNLYDRIIILKEDPDNRYHQFGDIFDAIRMLGNKSTHNYNTVDKDDIVELYQVIEFCIDKVYSTRENDIKEITSKMINKHKK